MSLRSRLVAVGVLGAIAAGAAEALDPGGPWTARLALGAGIVAGELLTLRVPDRDPLPLSYAIVPVLLRTGDGADFAAVVVGAQLMALVLRVEPAEWSRRLAVFGERLAASAAAFGAFWIVSDSFTDSSRRGVVLGALAAAAVAQLVVDDVIQIARARRLALPPHGAADLALVTSGMLMAIGYGGIEGSSEMGLWAPVLFSVPLLAAWYSFERLGSIRRTYEQTITALSVVPELAGLARQGHAQRVADTAVEVSRELDLDRRELEHVRAAALLHHIGHLCLDDPEVRGQPIDAVEVTEASATILRDTELLAPAGDLLATDTRTLGGDVLRVASAFDEFTQGDPARSAVALEALRSSPAYTYNGEVLDALERVLLVR